MSTFLVIYKTRNKFLLTKNIYIFQIKIILTYLQITYLLKLVIILMISINLFEYYNNNDKVV